MSNASDTHNKADERLKQLEWMLSEEAAVKLEVPTETHDQGYGDLTELNQDGIILKAIGRERLESLANDYLELLGTSSAIYEVNGNYAFGIFSSGWCRMMDCASRNLCDTADNAEALDSGRWLCHESCWTDCARRAIAECAPVDIACNGGIRMYTVPIQAQGDVVGAINFGYGDPPNDLEKIRKLAKTYHLDCDELVREANAYDSRPPFIIELARKRLHATARLIGSLVETRQAEDALRKSEETLRKTLNSIGDAVISTDMKGRVASMNPVAESLTGWSQQEAIGQPLETVFPIINEQTRKPVESPVTKVLKSGSIVGLANHSLLLARDGREIPIADSSAPIHNDAGEITGVVLVFRDQTKERADREALESNFALLRIAGETSKFGGWSVDLETDTQEWSDAVRNIHDVPLDYTPSIQEGIKFYAPEWRDRITEVFSACAEKGIPYDEEMEIITRKGSRRWVRTCGRAVRNEAGRIIKVHGSFQDITDYKQLGESLKESEDRLSKVVLAANDGIWDWDLRTNVVRFDPHYYQMSGYDVDEFPHKLVEFQKRIHPDDVDYVMNEAEKHLKGETDRFIVDFRFRKKSGDWQWIQGKGRIIERNEEGVPQRFVGTHRDISELKRADDKIWRIEKRNQALLDHSPVCHKIVDLDFKLKFMNKCGFKMLALEHDDDVLGKTYPFDFFPEKCRHELIRAMEHVIETGKNTEIETRACDSAGNEAWLHHTIIPVKNREESVDYLTIVASDITEQRNMQARIMHSEKMDSIGQLAGGVAHDFNNMLGVILGRTEMALEQTDPGQPIFEDLQEIRNAAKRSADLTRQLLTFARAQTVAPKVIDLNQKLEGILQMLRRLIGENIDLAWRPGEKLAPVKIDTSQIDQILINLCANARDAIEGVGKLTIETGSVRFDEEYCAGHPGYIPGDFIMLAVSDNGCGMDAETVSHLFEPFFTTKKQGKGTGLGLASVYGAVKQNNGFINVYSEPGHGTTFKVYLPQHQDGSLLQATGARVKPTANGSETILLVEDEPAILSMTKVILERQGYYVIAALTPGEAIRLANEHRGTIDLLMTDVVMPGMNGRDLAEKMLSLYPDLKCLFMSGYTANVIAHNGVLDEGVCFIQKPFSSQDLGAKLREVLEDKNAAQPS